MPIYMAAAAIPAQISAAIDWDAVTAVSTVALAGVTFLMVIATVWMAWNTGRALKQNNDLRNDANLHYKQTREQDQQHHEDGFRPVLVLTAPGGVTASARSGLVSVLLLIQAPAVLIYSPIKNIGSGLALNIRMSVRKDEITGFGPTIELAPIAAGDRLDPFSDCFELPVSFDTHFNETDLKTLPGGSWLVVLEYDDVFGNHFHTLHYKNTQQPWARTGRGSAPDTTPTLSG